MPSVRGKTFREVGRSFLLKCEGEQKMDGQMVAHEMRTDHSAQADAYSAERFYMTPLAWSGRGPRWAGHGLLGSPPHLLPLLSTATL